MSKEGIPYFSPGEYQRRYEAGRAMMDREGVDALLHGFGVDILPPSVRCTLFTPPAPFTFERNMTVVVQPNPATRDERMGVQLGELGLITGRGFEPMHRLPAEAVRVG